MNPVTYGITKEEYLYHGRQRTAYGIVAYEAVSDGEDAGIIASVRDLSENREAVEKLVDACNQAGLSIEHLQDIAEDFLTSL